jgi:hypothetical protein
LASSREDRANRAGIKITREMSGENRPIKAEEPDQLISEDYIDEPILISRAVI